MKPYLIECAKFIAVLLLKRVNSLSRDWFGYSYTFLNVSKMFHNSLHVVSHASNDDTLS